mgnify:CR=1 FL=1
MSQKVFIYPYYDSSGYKHYKYEIEISEYVEGRGGWAFMHNLGFSRYSYFNNLFIYTRSISGWVEADSVIYTFHRGNLEYPSIQCELKGFMEFLPDSTIIVNFLFPIYKDGINIDHWEQSRFNGKYRIIRKGNI